MNRLTRARRLGRSVRESRGVRHDVFTSGIWQTTTTLLSDGHGCVVVDPAYFPRELDAIAACAAARGSAAAVIFSHGHWDHVMGHAAFPGVPVHVSAALAGAVAGDDARAARYLADAREFDSRWYVPRPDGHRWPTQLHGLGDDARVTLAGIPVRALALPGHSPDGLGLVIEADGLLLVGDHLSPCEIPFVDDLPGYQATLRRLLDLLAHDLATVIPGHGHVLSAAEATAIAIADLAYLDRLAEASARRDVAAAAAIPLPRAADVIGMRDHHLENCRRVATADR